MRARVRDLAARYNQQLARLRELRRVLQTQQGKEARLTHALQQVRALRVR